LTQRDRRHDLLRLKVQPNAGRNEVVGFTDGVLQVKIAAPPDKGRANRELIDFLSEALGVRKSAITIVKGQTARSKLIACEGLSPADIIKRLTA
jgi:hypothetical protein